MKQRSNSRRSRGRGVGKHQPKNSNFDSNGPEVRVRGSAQQVQEKYLLLALDANASGDRIAAEAFFQYAEHYHRIINNDGNNGAGKGQNRGGRDNKKQSGPAKTAPQGETEVIDTSAPVLAVVSEAENADSEAQPAAEASADPESEPEPGPIPKLNRTKSKVHGFLLLSGQLN